MTPDTASDVISQLPSWDQIWRVMPITFNVLVVASLGFFAGYKLQQEHIKTLREQNQKMWDELVSRERVKKD